MAKFKNIDVSKKKVITTPNNNINNVFLVADLLNCKDEDIQLFNDIIDKYKVDNQIDLKLIVLSDDISFSKISDKEYAKVLIEKNILIHKNYLVHNDLIEESKYFYISFVNISKAFNINEILNSIKKLDWKDNTNYLPKYSNTDKQNKSHTSIFATTSEKMILQMQNFKEEQKTNIFNLKYFSKKLNIDESSFALNIANNTIFTKQIPVLSGFVNRLKNLMDWYFIIPIKELKNKTYPIFHKNSALWRLSFALLMTILLFALPRLALNSGISGDEDVHYTHAKYVYNYFDTDGKDTTCLNTPKTMLQYYGQSFDNVSYIINKWFGIENEYEARHVMNAIVGWAAILFAGLLAAELSGFLTALITIILLFLSPSFLGHTYNNLKDIPFAFAYIYSFYQMIHFLKEMPKPSVKRMFYLMLGIAFSVSIRAGGLLLIAYLFMFVGLYWLVTCGLKNVFKKENFGLALKSVLYITLLSLVAFIIGIQLWPYALKAPIDNVKASLDMMTNFTTSLKQLFEGKIIWSDAVPWYYLPKYIFMTSPILILLGLGLFATFFFYIRKHVDKLMLYILIFSFVFPIAYIIYKGSNLYGGWRHVLFAYPPIIVCVALGYSIIFEKFKNKIVKYATILVFAILAFLPIKHIAKNHPHEYIYYNEFTGGVEKMNGYYEMDYYFHSTRAAALWLKDYILKNDIKDVNDTVSPKITIVSNDRIFYFFKDLKNRVQPKYARFYERSNTNWDYYIAINSYINPYQLQNKIWPPKGTIHTIDVDNVPMCAIIKRPTYYDFPAYKEFTKNNNDSAITLYKKAILEDPENEYSLMNLGLCFINKNQYDTALIYLNRSLKTYPSFEAALYYRGWSYLNLKKFEEAKNDFSLITQNNVKSAYGHFGMANLYLQKNDAKNGIYYLEKSIEADPGFKQGYMVLGNVYRNMGDEKKANHYLNIVSRL